MEFDTGRGRAILLTPRQRWSSILSVLVVVVGLALGLNMRDSSIGRSTEYSNFEAGITAHYPVRWLLDETGDYVLRVRDMTQRGFNTVIEVTTLPVGPDTSERNLLDNLTLRRAQTLIDYTVVGYDNYMLPNETAAVSMSYSFVSRDSSPLLQGASTIVAGLDILTFSRGQAVIISFRADADVFLDELPTLRRFIENLEY